MEAAQVRRVNIDEEMQQAYLDYAMSVIVSRALPDARDGLKPVHRRILYAMHDMGLRPETSYKKSARVVGEVLGKYHPHSDTAVYDAMARMAQAFSMRVALVDGQGNFGSVDGDPPAAMRYTEARLTPPAMDILADIQKNTVDFSENFDASLREPDVLPAAFPNLLVNGATGIAVGMSTNVPPHNLGEVMDALKYMLENWSKLDDISVEDLMAFIKGPDFPTGGVIIQAKDEEGLSSAYGSGRGKIMVQARAHVEATDRGRERILVTELPYQVNKATLIERIAALAREGQIEGISDLRDESDRQGMRIVIELSKTADASKVLQALYKRTPMQSTFGIIMLALVKGEPRLLSLKQALRVYVEHRLEVVRRRSEHDLEKARQRGHLLEGLRVALNNLDAVIELIRKASDADEARGKLMKRFELSEVQANAILDMPLRRLAALERKKIETEYKEVQALIKGLEDLLASPKKVRSLVAKELEAVKAAYADRRRTQIVTLGKGEVATEMLTAHALETGRPVWVAINAQGQVARSEEDKAPRPSGKDAPRWLLRASSRDTLFLVTANGKAAALPIHALPQANSPAGGESINRVSALKAGDALAAVFALPPHGERPPAYLLTVTEAGIVKKSEIAELPGPGSQAFRLANVKAGDKLISAVLTDGTGELFLASASGLGIRFKEEEVRSMGLAAAGVAGIRLEGKDRVVGAVALNVNEAIFLLATDGKAKRVSPEQFPVQGRHGKGVIAWKLEGGIQLIGMANQKGTTRATIHLKRLAAKAVRLDEAPMVSRQANGKPLFEMRDDDEVVALVSPSFAANAGPTRLHAQGGSPEQPRQKRPAASKPKPKKK